MSLEHGKLKILLVDDDSIAQKVHQHMLSDLECYVDLAKSGEEALELLNTHEDYHFIFMDMQLPGLSGAEITAEIRAREANKKPIPIIVLTGHTEEEVKKLCLSVGANLFLTKPINKEKLKNILENFHSRKYK